MRRISTLLDEIAVEYISEGSVIPVRTKNLWQEAVGKIISSKTMLTKIQDGKIFVKVESPVWKQEISFRKVEIINRVNQLVGKQVINEIILH